MLKKIRATEPSFTAGGAAMWEPTSTATVEDILDSLEKFLFKLNILLPYDLAIVLLGTSPNELKTSVHAKTCTRMFMAALFVIAKTWTQQRCPSRGD